MGTQSGGDQRGSVQLTSVTKRFGDQVAVDSLDLTVAPGEFLSLLGPSGCGKTTTLRMIAGFEFPDEGVIRLSGSDISAVPPYKRDVNTVFQHYALFPHMTVAENIGYGLRQKKVPKSEIVTRVKETLELVKMTKFAHRKPRQMSGGQQQRVALARALVNRPSVLLLDEPLAALDRKLRQEMQIELKLIQAQVGITFVFVTHDQEEALSMSDRIAVMLDGHIEQLADADTVYDQPVSAFVAGFIGQQNFLSGALSSDGREFVGSGFTVVGARQCDDAASGQPGLAAIRPEVLEPTSGHRDAGPNQIRATVAGVSPLGDVIQFVLRTHDGKELLSRRPRHDAPKLVAGDEVWLTWDPTRVHLFGERQRSLVLANSSGAAS
jgi:spermidine/putrescine transport system ATP-binding protein